MIRGTYATPHRHLDPPKSESFLVLADELAFFTFDVAGQVLARTSWAAMQLTVAAGSQLVTEREVVSTSPAFEDYWAALYRCRRGHYLLDPG